MWQALDSADHETLRAAIDRLATGMSLLGHNEVATAIRGARSHISSIAEELQTQRHAFGPWVFGLHGLLGWVDRYARRSDETEVEVFHDHNSFEAALSESVTFMKSQPTADRYWGSGGVFTTGYPTIGDLTFVDSRDEPLIQLADTLASSVVDACLVITQGRRGSDETREIFAQTVQRADGHANFVTNQQLFDRLHAAARRWS